MNESMKLAKAFLMLLIGLDVLDPPMGSPLDEA
jgi:hypothetical protein